MFKGLYLQETRRAWRGHPKFRLAAGAAAILLTASGGALAQGVSQRPAAEERSAQTAAVLPGEPLSLVQAIELANNSRSVVRVVVGNEALFREEITPEDLIVLLDRVRAAVKVPVTTSEQWHIWEKYPQLAKHVDLIAAHILPYWEFIPVDKAGEFVLDRARDLKKMFPKKPLLLSEVGWPSNGRMRGGADATPADQAIYLRTLVNTLNRRGYNYFVIEAFDQPWKASDEGSVGAYWGVYNAARVFSGWLRISC